MEFNKKKIKIERTNAPKKEKVQISSPPLL
jgi:hypothetical protein